MADNDYKPVTYVKEGRVDRTCTSPVQQVNLEADGWVLKGSPKKASPAKKVAAKAPAKKVAAADGPAASPEDPDTK